MLNFVPFMLKISFWDIATPISLVILLGIVGFWVSIWLRARSAAKTINQAEFSENMRKAQVVDVREPAEYKASHIMGARNLPYSLMKTTKESLRKDQPIYLYEQRKLWAMRAAILLKKQGYHDLYILKGGFEDWQGKVKRKNNA